MSRHNSVDNHSVDRRDYIKKLGIASGAVALAGCADDEDDANADDDDDTADAGQAGERVPTITLSYWSDAGSTSVVFEQSLPRIVDDLEEALGIDVDAGPATSADQIGSQSNDSRSFHLSYDGYSLAPTRLDPHELTNARYSIMSAGANGVWNPPNYANCDFSVPAAAQLNAADIEERQELVTEAHSQMSEDIGTIALCQRMQYGAAWTDKVDVRRAGEMGLIYVGATPLIHSVPKGDFPIRVNYQPRTLETSIYQTSAGAANRVNWANLVYSPLVGYDENYELEPVLAEGWEFTDGGLTLTIPLRDGEFHNGDPITAEDVKWTFEFQWDQSDEGNYPDPVRPPLESLDVIDEKTIQFNLERPAPFLLTRSFPGWGILPKNVWQEAGAEEDPTGFDDPIIGSGPYQVTSFSEGTLLAMEPHDNHAKYDVEGDLILQGFDSTEAAFRSFRNEELEMFLDSPPGLANEIRDTMSDNADVFLSEGFTNYMFHAQMPFGPGSHRPFRLAVSQAIDRSLINETAMFNDSQEITFSCPLSPTHPFFPGEDNLTQIADSPEGNPDRAREVLEEAGYTWDDDGNLHYPDDIDLTPAWPEGDEPADHPDQFPCVEDLQGVN